MMKASQVESTNPAPIATVVDRKVPRSVSIEIQRKITSAGGVLAWSLPPKKTSVSKYFFTPALYAGFVGRTLH